MPGSALSLPEREEIGRALTLDPTVSWATLADRIDRHPTTIAREVDRNGGRDRYRPAVADRQASQRARRPRQRLLQTPGGLRDRVTQELRVGRSPYAIAADLAAEGVTGGPCVETIYTAVYAAVLDVKARDCLRMRRPRRRPRQARNPSTRLASPNIGARPAAVDDRSEPGHWEADQVRHEALFEPCGDERTPPSVRRSGQLKLGAAWQAGTGLLGGKQPRQRRDRPALSDGLGPASKTGRCT